MMTDVKHLDLVLRNDRKNRTIVSNDIPLLLQDVADAAGVELLLHRFASGDDIGTWIVPPRCEPTRRLTAS